MTRAVIYARVSPTKHIKTPEDVHASLAESIRVCRTDAEREGDEILEEYIDEYVSGKSSKFMPNFQKMITDAEHGEFDRVYCRRVNRFGRNRADMITAQILLEKLGVSIKFVEDGIDTLKPFGKSIMAVLAELAQQDREEILRNTERGRIAAKERGVKFGKPKKEFNVRAIRQLRLLPINNPDRPTWSQLEKDYGVTRSTIIARLKEHGYWDHERRTVK
jgi:DNA invertase Pin-like site-specific DNA recombinase